MISLCAIFLKIRSQPVDKGERFLFSRQNVCKSKPIKGPLVFKSLEEEKQEKK